MFPFKRSERQRPTILPQQQRQRGGLKHHTPERALKTEPAPSDIQRQRIGTRSWDWIVLKTLARTRFALHPE
jgi:hypothetical protein